MEFRILHIKVVDVDHAGQRRADQKGDEDESRLSRVQAVLPLKDDRDGLE